MRKAARKRKGQADKLLPAEVALKGDELSWAAVCM